MKLSIDKGIFKIGSVDSEITSHYYTYKFDLFIIQASINNNFTIHTSSELATTTVSVGTAAGCTATSAQTNPKTDNQSCGVRIFVGT